MGTKLPKTPVFWGDDLNGLEISRTPDENAPVSVTDPDSLKAITPTAPMTRGHAQSPAEYARMGEMARQLGENAYDPDGNSGLGGLGYWAGQSLNFKRGSNLDAQSHGASQNYGNYVFGVYNAAAGTDLPLTLDLANTYGKYRSTYHLRPDQMDKTYTSIPTINVQSITKGYNDYHNGTFWQHP